MLDWLVDLLAQAVIWISARSTVEVLLFMIWLYLVAIFRSLSEIKSTLQATRVAILDARETVETVKLDVQGIRIIVYETMTATLQSRDAIEKIRGVYAPHEYEKDLHPE